MTQVPSIGRIVHYVDQYGVHLPAIITHVALHAFDIIVFGAGERLCARQTVLMQPGNGVHTWHWPEMVREEDVELPVASGSLPACCTLYKKGKQFIARCSCGWESDWCSDKVEQFIGYEVYNPAYNTAFNAAADHARECVNLTTKASTMPVQQPVEIKAISERETEIDALKMELASVYKMLYDSQEQRLRLVRDYETLKLQIETKEE